MPDQVICNFHKDPIKTKQAMLHGTILEARSNKGFFQISGVGNLTVISLIWLDFKLLRDFTPVLIICNQE